MAYFLNSFSYAGAVTSAHAMFSLAQRKVALLAAILPSVELNSLYSPSPAGFGNFDEILIGKLQPVFGRVDLNLLPRVNVLDPRGHLWCLQPSAAPRCVNVRACMPVAGEGLEHQGLRSLGCAGLYEAQTIRIDA